MDYPTFINQAAQGDLLFTRVDKVPDGAKRAIPVDGRYIIGHSESNHHHTMLADDVVFYYVDDPMIAYVEVLEPTPIIHEKTGPDAHPGIMFEVGIFEVCRQEEETPEGFRRVAD